MNKTTSNALRILDAIAGPDPKMQGMIEAERTNLQVARQIHELRTKAGISQKELADKLGTTQSAISRLEDADYDGHSLTMLQRVAAALDRRVEIRFVRPQRGKPARGGHLIHA